MRGKKRPQAERAHAVGLAVMTSIAEASRQTGIPQPTLHAWYHSAEYEELRTRKKAAVDEEWWTGVQMAFRRTVELLGMTEDPVKAATAGAIIFDKLALSRGEATVRTESTLLQGRSDHEQRILAELINGVLEGRADSHAPGDQGVDPVEESKTAEASTAEW